MGYTAEGTFLLQILFELVREVEDGKCIVPIGLGSRHRLGTRDGLVKMPKTWVGNREISGHGETDSPYPGPFSMLEST